jgi:hypothetical protein
MTVVTDYVKTIPSHPPINHDGMEQVLLLVGLAAREIWRWVAMREGNPEQDSPAYIKKNPIGTDGQLDKYLTTLFDLPFYKVPAKGVKRKADKNPSGARYVVPQCLSQLLQTVT